ncbi:MAG: DUF350 domain-containing protein [Nitrospirae bacterium]|nr:MAG: DUF350 domain-containing protein [Nitrospirota bacterium]
MSYEELYYTALDVGAAIVYLLLCFLLFLLGKFFFKLMNSSVNIKEELVKKDNVAFAIVMSGYYLGIMMAIGGALVGPNNWESGEELRIFVKNIIDLLLYGCLSIILMNLSAIINDRVILYQFSNRDEIIRDRNEGAGVVVGVGYLCTGLIVWGAVSGEGGAELSNISFLGITLGGILSTLVFWTLGQVAMIIAGFIYNWITPYDVHDEIERDNVAAGIGFAGALLAIGNLIRISIEGDFISWSENLLRFSYVVVLGLILLPIIRTGVDKILLPGERLTDEIVNQEKPNLGAAFLEAFSYVGLSFLIGWAI